MANDIFLKLTIPLSQLQYKLAASRLKYRLKWRVKKAYPHYLVFLAQGGTPFIANSIQNMEQYKIIMKPSKTI